MRRRSSPAPSVAALAVPVALAVLVIGCGSMSTPTTAGVVPSATSALAPSVVELSLPPANETGAPPAIALPPELPSLEPPPASPPPPPGVSIQYTAAPADLAGFVAAYRETFGLPDMEAAPIDEAGARLCTYMQRHADPGGLVRTDRAVTEADINEPGYPREVWLVAYELASAFYCPELVLDGSEVAP